MNTPANRNPRRDGAKQASTAADRTRATNQTSSATDYARRRRSRSDYSGLSITALAFGTMLSVALIAVGCGENIGSTKTAPETEQTVAQADRYVDQNAETEAPSDGSTVLLPASVEVNPAHEQAEPVSFENAEKAYNERRYDDATRLFAGYVADNQDNAWGYYMLGLSSWKSGDKQAAEQAFSQALELDRGHVKSWVNMGRVLIELERPDEALANVDEALTLEPESNAALRTRGRALEELGRIDEAVATYMDALAVDEEDAWSMNNMGLAYIRSERFSDAVPPLARAVELRDDVSVFYNNLGIALERSGFIVEARDAFSSAVAVDSSNTKAVDNLARLEGMEGDPDAEPLDLGRLAVEFADRIVRYVAETEAPVPADMSAVPAPADESAEVDSTATGEVTDAAGEAPAIEEPSAEASAAGIQAASQKANADRIPTSDQQ